jgi:hypothetical protein
VQCADVFGVEQRVMLPWYFEDIDIGTSPPPGVIVTSRKSGPQQDGGRFQRDRISICRCHPWGDRPDQKTHAQLLLQDRIKRESRR